MFVKWIKVHVPESKKEAFSQAQEKWGDLKDVNGFLGQVGGWNLHNNQEACILGFWHDLNAYKAFMKFNHDPIYENSEQKGTYENIEITFYHSIYQMNQYNPLSYIKDGKILRVAECTIHAGHAEHFEKMQLNVWNKGMSSCSGFLGGVFSKGDEKENKYLVTSFWNDLESHKEYIRSTLPNLIVESKSKEDLSCINGILVKLNESWCVLPMLTHYFKRRDV